MPNNVNKIRATGGRMPLAEWPNDAPSKFEDRIISISVGNSNFHWALHLGVEHKFIPSLFWNTPHSDEDEEDYDKSDPCDLLMTHIAFQAHTLIFGDNDNLGCIQQASEAAAKRKSPILSIYVVSSNPEAERKLIYMFRHIPVRMFKLQNTDFFTAEQGLYPTMGVDRVAVLHGAKVTYGSPVLAVDGGTAMTYAGLDKDGKIMGGGISPGVKVRLQSLHEHTGALPLIDHAKFKAVLDKAMQSKQSLPVFAKDTEVAMITTVCSELACQLRNIIKQFVAAVAGENGFQNGSSHDIIHVIITGGDGELFRLLLDKDASGIIPIEPGVEPIPDFVKIRYSKNFSHYGIGDLLYKKCLARPVGPYEELRNKMQGARVAMKSSIEKSGISRGTVLSVDFDPPSAVEQPATVGASHNVSNYSFLIRHDNTAKQQMLSLKQFYDGLLLYDEVGEDPEKNPNNELTTKRNETSKEVQEILVSKSQTLGDRKVELQQYIDNKGLKDFFGCQSESERHAKRRKLAMRGAIENPKQYEGKRVAKEFAIEDPDDPENMIDDVFFGTVEHLSDEGKLWYFVRYDDGDSEELELKDVQWGIKFYEMHKEDDLKAAAGEGGGQQDMEEDEEAKVEIDPETREPIHNDPAGVAENGVAEKLDDSNAAAASAPPAASNGDNDRKPPAMEDAADNAKDKADLPPPFISL